MFKGLATVAGERNRFVICRVIFLLFFECTSACRQSSGTEPKYLMVALYVKQVQRQSQTDIL